MTYAFTSHITIMSTKTSSQYTIIKKVQTIIGRKTNKQNTTRYTTQSPKDEEGTDNLTLKGRGKEHEKSVIFFFFIKC